MSYWYGKQVNIRPVGTSCRRHIVTKTRLRFPDVPQTSYCDENKTKFFKRPADVVWTSTCDQKKTADETGRRDQYRTSRRPSAAYWAIVEWRTHTCASKITDVQKLLTREKMSDNRNEKGKKSIQLGSCELGRISRVSTLIVADEMFIRN